MRSLAVDEVCWLDGSVALIVRGVVDDDTCRASIGGPQ